MSAVLGPGPSCLQQSLAQANLIWCERIPYSYFPVRGKAVPKNSF